MTRHAAAIQIAERSKGIQVAVGEQPAFPENGIFIGPVFMGIISVSQICSWTKQANS